MKTTNKLLMAALIATTTLGAVSCKSSNAVKGGAIGGAAGGVLGGVIAGKGNTAVGVLIGSAIGGSAGAIIGNQMDKAADELERDLEGAEVERVGEGIKITFDSGLMFAVNKSDLSEMSKQNLLELVETLKKYEDTNILIAGHTDDTGAEDYNMNLSRKRAYSVEDYLTANGIAKKRMEITAYGEMQPKVTNDTEAGRQQNRRVEVAIYANEKMQKKAENGELKDL
ncbi:outer membrane protein OmpA-like peptidoglycan-associated protein [Algoriphagus ratkowskyi]|uniref:OmpA family protein n=1 Tax=Algoriphagus ratkowskyi TaxID=57028 RepID=A0A2W7R5H1_9BACT|nr:OmpA family protein [Algoriphagus ratkowskyi]PZX51107.1 outer membrane protein OmpA-like peptidoglycan-associated protein [Algoriphagus ratkowskyi]TXD75895.1 OmpA family protein [Algoriphagus ratkowskyi]